MAVDLSLEELIETRGRLICDINQDMTDKERAFLLSVKSKTPDLSLLEMQSPQLIAELASVMAVNKSGKNVEGETSKSI